MIHSLLENLSYTAQRGLLGGASLIVSSDRRSDWRKEWRGELWQVRRETSGRSNSMLEMEAARIRFCVGAIADAWCLRGRGSIRQKMAHRSALDCILGLACVLLACAAIARTLPGVRAELDAMRHRARPAVLLIEDAQSSTGSPIAAVSQKEFRDWQATGQRFFDAISYYRSERAWVDFDGGAGDGLEVARVSPNLFAVLGIPVLLHAAPASAAARRPEAVLSYQLWVRKFDSDPAVIGRALRIGGETVQIAGIAPSTSLRLPGNPAMWVVSAQVDRESDTEANGFVIAHLSIRGQAAFAAHGDHIPIAVGGEDPDEASLVGVALRDESKGPVALGGFALFLAFLALPAVVSVSLGEANYSAHRPSWRRQCMRWLFMAAKIGFVIAIAYCASMAIAYAMTSAYSPNAEFAQFALGFVFSLFGLRWAVFDQRQRCPVCLRLVTNPTRVGLASHTFLGWNGTEMYCEGGHTLLHVPALPTSWFQAPRWVYLDPSWGFLFSP